MFEEYDDNFIDNATASELETAGDTVYYASRKFQYGTPEKDALLALHEKIVNRKFELWKNPDPNFRWTDESRWDRD